jgi:hypothetical protein
VAGALRTSRYTSAYWGKSDRVRCYEVLEAVIEYLWVQIVLSWALSDVGVAIVYLVEGTEKEVGIDSRRIGWFGWGSGLVYGGTLRQLEAASDDSSQRLECDLITWSFAKRRKPAKNKDGVP